MEENEDVLSSESKMSVTQNSWVSPEDSMEAFKNTIASVPATRLPLNLFMSPMNGKTLNHFSSLCEGHTCTCTYVDTQSCYTHTESYNTLRMLYTLHTCVPHAHTQHTCNVHMQRTQ